MYENREQNGFKKGAHALSFNTPEVLHPKLVGQGCPEPWGPTQKRKVAVRSFSDLGKKQERRRGVDDLYRKG